MPSSGSFNRSGVNYEAGARTPLASVFASIMLLLVLLAVAPLAAYLPNAAMAGILFLVAWGLIDFHHIEHIWHTSKAESAILVSTLIGTLINLEMGIFIGVFLSLVNYLYRSSKPEILPVVPAPEEGAYHFTRARGKPECPQMRIVRINGAVYFGAASYVQQALQQIDEDNPRQKSVLIDAGRLTTMDIAGAEILAQEARRRRRLGGGLYFYRLDSTIRDFLRKGDYLKDIGEGAFFPVMTNVTGALYWTLNPDICRNCKPRIFKECHGGILPDGLRRQRLMLATDGSEFALPPTAVAVALAKAFGVTLDVMTAVASEADDETAKLRLAAVVDTARRAGVDTEEIVRHGKLPVQQVIGAAADADSSILVIGRRPPRGDFKEKMVGDIALQIILEAPCHVLITGGQSKPWEKRILFPTDGSPICDTAVELAAQIAKASWLPVTVLAVVGKDGTRQKAEEDVAQKAAFLKAAGVACDTRVVEGVPSQAILRVIDEIGADLVVIGNNQSKGLKRTLTGSTTDKVIGRIACPVLVVKRQPEPEQMAAAVKNQA